MTRDPDLIPPQADPMTEIDLRAIGAALRRSRRTVILVTLLTMIGILAFVSVVKPRYTAESQLLLENQETFFTRPDRVNLQADVASQLDPEAVASQVQLIGSRDIARRAIKELGLEGNPEFDPEASGIGPLKQILVMLGLAKDPSQETRDDRIVTTFLEKLTVYSPPKTRVISVQFTCHDPELAARAANTIAALYLKGQSAAKRTTARESADALGGQIADLRTKLAAADAAREQYRQQSGLLAGTNNMTISGQQLADINTDLSKARTAQADAQAKASTIRDLLRAGKAADVPDVINNDTVRRVADQRLTAQAQLALEARTLLPGHPRIKALVAQLDEYDLALKTAARQAATTLENEAKIAGTRVANLEAVLTQQKKLAGVANVDEVRLHDLERAAQSLKDQLDSSNTKYQEALARQSSMATPADARIISRAVAPQEPSYPKKIPFIAFGTLAVFVAMVGFIVASELLSGRATVDERSLRVRSEAWDDAPRRAAPTGSTPSGTDPRGPAPRGPSGSPPPGGGVRVTRPSASDPDGLVFAPLPEERGRSRASLLDRLRARSPSRLVNTLIDYIDAFGRSAADAREEAFEPRQSGGFGWDDDHPLPAQAAPQQDAAPAAIDYEALADRVVASHVPGHGLHVVAAALDAADAANDIIITLARALADKGRSVLVDLNRSPAKLATLMRVGSAPRDGIDSLTGLSELLAGDASFADVIHRDHASRLHFIPTGKQEADFRDFDLILDALSETYDFIVMLAPAFPNGEITRIMSPYADFVVLASVSEPDQARITSLETELIEAGARNVLVASPSRQAVREVA